jgi:hypothetical protein
MGMRISWMSAGPRTVGIGRAGPVVAVMADGVIAFTATVMDQGGSAMKRLTTSIDLSTFFEDLI